MSSHSIESSKAFVNTFEIKPRNSGELRDLSFAVKDNIDVGGFATSFGSTSWLESHSPATNHATCVEQLLSAGATCVGKTISDELTCSLDGENLYFGTPLNPITPDRVPGGSSSGSASAVACGLVDFALGTDSAGSIRVPGSNCGVFGLRPSLHRISESGVLPFAPSSSTVGVLACDLKTLERVAKVLLSSCERGTASIGRIYLLKDAFSLASREISIALEKEISGLAKRSSVVIEPVSLSEIVGEKTDLESWRREIFSPLQCSEIWNAVGAWIEDKRPQMSPRVSESMKHFKSFDRSSLSRALSLREKMFHKVADFVGPDDLVCFPTVPRVAPFIGELDEKERNMDYYMRTMSVTCFSSVAALPEVTLPLVKVNGASVGFSFAASHRRDEFLLASVSELFQRFG